jgi:hypothetical protein
MPGAVRTIERHWCNDEIVGSEQANGSFATHRGNMGQLEGSFAVFFPQAPTIHPLITCVHVVQVFKLLLVEVLINLDSAGSDSLTGEFVEERGSAGVADSLNVACFVVEAGTAGCVAKFRCVASGAETLFAQLACWLAFNGCFGCSWFHL